MNELLQKHGCSNVFTVPEGLKELMSDITREVLRQQPPNIYDFISNYLSVMMITREHGVMAVKILDDLCDCRPTVSQHLIQLGIDPDQASSFANVIREEIESVQPSDGKETIKEYQIVKKILKKSCLDEVTTAKVCQVARNAYRDYWYRKKTMEKSLKMKPEEPWEIAAQRTLELYKRTKPSFSELTRATQKIQAAYRGYHVRRNILRHLKPKQKKKGPKVALLGPPLDVAESREFDLGPLLSINVREDDMKAMFEEDTTQKLGLSYDPMKTITHQPDEDYVEVMEFPETTNKLIPMAAPTLQIQVPSIEPGQNSAEPYLAPVSPPVQNQVSEEDIALQKITFASVTPEEITVETEAVIEDDHEIKEVIPADNVTDTEEKVDEVPEDVPEDIAVSEDEGATAPSASLESPHDTHDTPDTHDTHDTHDDTDEEGLQDITEEEG